MSKREFRVHSKYEEYDITIGSLPLMEKDITKSESLQSKI